MKTVRPDFPDAESPARRQVRRTRLALCLAAAAVGESRIGGVTDVAMHGPAVKALSAFGVSIESIPGGWAVRGLGWGGLLEPGAPVDVGGDRDLLAALMGLAAPQPILAVFAGTATAASGVAPLLAPLSILGARVTQAGGGMPLVQAGAALPLPWSHRSGAGEGWMADALLLAGLATPGETTVQGSGARHLALDLFRRFGAQVAEADADGAPAVRITGQAELVAATLDLSA